MSFEALETGIGLDVILWLQEARTGWMEILARIFDVAGEELAYVLLLAIIYWLVDKSLGKRLLFALGIITLLTLFFKDLLGRPRPYLVSDAVLPVFEDIGYGIPSGHTGISLMVWGLIALWMRQRWLTIVAITYILLQGLFRMVAGVHFPQDVIAGLLLGSLALALYYPLSRRVAAHLDQHRPREIYSAALVSALIAFALIFLLIDAEVRSDYLSMIGLLSGGAIGAVFEAQHARFTQSDQGWRQGAMFIIGLVLTVAVLLGLDILFALIAADGTLPGDILRVLRYGLVAFVAVGLWPYLAVQRHFARQEQVATA